MTNVQYGAKKEGPSGVAKGEKANDIALVSC